MLYGGRGLLLGVWGFGGEVVVGEESWRGLGWRGGAGLGECYGVLRGLGGGRFWGWGLGEGERGGRGGRSSGEG